MNKKLSDLEETDVEQLIAQFDTLKRNAKHSYWAFWVASIAFALILYMAYLLIFVDATQTNVFLMILFAMFAAIELWLVFALIVFRRKCESGIQAAKTAAAMLLPLLMVIPVGLITVVAAFSAYEKIWTIYVSSGILLIGLFAFLAICTEREKKKALQGSYRTDVQPTHMSRVSFRVILCLAIPMAPLLSFAMRHGGMQRLFGNTLTMALLLYAAVYLSAIIIYGVMAKTLLFMLWYKQR